MAANHVPASAERFRAAVPHYLAGRPPYADVVLRRVAALLRLGPQHRVLDLGCGPGQLARGFAPLAGTVLAMDPSPEMLRLAAAASAGVPNLRCVAGGSADLSAALGRFRLVAMGRSFHWMDRAAILQRLDDMLEPGGAVALFHTAHARIPVNAWAERFQALRHHYAGKDEGDPHRRDPGWIRHEGVLLESAFRHLETIGAFTCHTVTADRLVSRVLSMSSTSPARLGARAATLAQDVRDLVAAVAPKGELTEVIETTALLAFRPGEEPAP